jgi:hypothetical protein
VSRFLVLLCLLLSTLLGGNELAFRRVAPPCCARACCGAPESSCCKKKLEVTVKEKTETRALAPAASPELAPHVALASVVPAGPLPATSAFTVLAHETRSPPPRTTTVLRF